MGAKDLEWRVGGSGKGAPDGGRDLEATFLIPTPDGEVTKQRWWVEAKGRTGTVEITALQQAVLNAQGRDDVDVLIVVTNTTYSNPTRDWVKKATRNRPRPAVRLWDRADLERLLPRYPTAVLHVFSRALSPQGRLEVIRHKLWNFCAFTDGKTLSELWKQRIALRWGAASQFSVIASEIANGDLARRPWTTTMTDEDLAACLVHAVANTFYLVKRADDAGVDQYPLLCTIAHLLIATLMRFDELRTASLLQYALSDQNDTPYPKDVGKLLLGPVLNRAFLELRDECSYDCLRVRLRSSDACFDDSQRKAYWSDIDSTRPRMMSLRRTT